MIVVDATVLIKCYLSEIYSDECVTLIESGQPIATAEIAISQIATALWKRSRTGEVKASEATRILGNLAKLPIHFEQIAPLAEQAMELSTFSARTFNESLYFVLALRHQPRVVSADHRWCNLLSTGKLKPYIEFVGDTNARLRKKSA